MESLSHILFLLVLLGLLVFAAASQVPPLLRRHRVRKQEWLRARQRCEQCGYDVRTTTGKCPECGAETGRIDRTGDSNYMQQDMPCQGCGVTLRGRLKIGFCSACGCRVRASQLAQVQRALGCGAPVVQLFRRAIRLAVARKGAITAERPIPIAARELCLAVRDEAIRETGNAGAARAMLFARGITDSDKIGLVIQQFSAAELLIRTPEDEQKHYAGLFDLDSLFAAVEESLPEGAG